MEGNFFVTAGGGQFLEILPDNRVKVISAYDFNPGIEIRQMRAGLLQELKCRPCTETEFDDAEVKAMQLLGLVPSKTVSTSKQLLTSH